MPSTVFFRWAVSIFFCGLVHGQRTQVIHSHRQNHIQKNHPPPHHSFGSKYVHTPQDKLAPYCKKIIYDTHKGDWMAYLDSDWFIFQVVVVERATCSLKGATQLSVGVRPRYCTPTPLLTLCGDSTFCETYVQCFADFDLVPE